MNNWNVIEFVWILKALHKTCPLTSVLSLDLHKDCTFLVMYHVRFLNTDKVYLLSDRQGVREQELYAHSDNKSAHFR